MTRDPVRITQVGVVLGLVLLVVLGWLFVLSPRFQTTGELEVRAADLELGQLNLTRRERDLLDLAADLPATAEQAQRLFSAMPQTAELPALLTQLTSAAKKSGIPADRIEVINTAIPESVDTTTDEGSAAADIRLATMRVDMTVVGSPSQLTKFIAAMENLERSFVITDVTVVAGGLKDSDEDTLTLAGTMFVLESELPDLIEQAETVAAGVTTQQG